MCCHSGLEHKLGNRISSPGHGPYAPQQVPAPHLERSCPQAHIVTEGRKHRESYQRGTLVQLGPSWFFRYREYNSSGELVAHRSKKLGSLTQYPTRAKAEKATETIRTRINERRL